MVGRIVWNIGAGLVHRVLHKGNIRPGMGFAYPAVWRARPGFLDCDINLHLNNASYLFNMELARWHFCAVTGILGNVARHRRALLVASQAVRFRHPIPPFRPYEIRSQLVFADDEWMYFLHQFQCPTTGKLYAEGLCRASCRQDGARVSAATLYAEVFGGDADALQTPDMPDVVKQLLEWDGAPRIELETPAEATRRERETAMPSAEALAGKKALASATRSWNLPV
ncbi:THEM6 protein [Phytophthora cinnamomi]|uniref:THEM6 protein n=1 Tax=Phytophthora cinnamomi TaxID=4785 RepID=UPI00355AB0E8|nr:THEM6 protein [Phytophthora cinnamomi]